MGASATLETRKKDPASFMLPRGVEASLRPAPFKETNGTQPSVAEAMREEPNFDHDFSRIPTQGVSSHHQALQPESQSCPLALSDSRTCPFGGACHICPARVQTKRAINQSGDIYEQEADRVATEVVHMRGEPTQRRTADQLQPDAVPPIVHEVLQSPGQPLDSHTRTLMESHFGRDLSQVQVHADERAARSAHLVNARSYAAGQHIVFEKGQYVPHTNEGRWLIAHELTHVVQQGRRGFSIQRKEEEKSPCAVHGYDNSNPKDTAVIPKSGGIGVSSVADLVSKVNAYIDDPKKSCRCINRLEVNGHGTDGYQSVGNGNLYVNDDKALVHDSKEDHLKQMANIKFCSRGLLMLMGCHVGQGKGKTLLSRLSAILPGKLIGGAQHYTAGTGLGEKRVVGAGDLINKDGTMDWDKADPFLTSPFVRWHITIAGKEYVINGMEATSSESKAKLKTAEKIKVKTPEGEVKIK